MVNGFQLAPEVLLQLERWRELHEEASVADVVQKLLRGWADRDPTGAALTLRDLTPRQRQVLKLIAEEKTNKAIAGHLRVDVKTVESHRSVLMKKLKARSLAGLVKFAIRSGLLTA